MIRKLLNTLWLKNEKRKRVYKKKSRNLFVFPKYAILLKIVFLWNRKKFSFQDTLFYFKIDFCVFRSYYLGLLCRKG